MSKGYMVFVEGTNPPQKVHKGIDGAFREMHRLARLCPGKEVMLLQLHKRVMSDSGEARPRVSARTCRLAKTEW